MKNFKLTNESIEVNGRTLYRIECIKDFKYAKVGDKGGFVESEDNLSDEAWISGDACVYDGARVFQNAWVGGRTRIFDKARVFNNACVSEDATIFGSATIFEDAEISGMAEIGGMAEIFGEAWVLGNAEVGGTSKIFGESWVFDGDWSETPFQVQGSKHFVNICSPTELKIGCEMHTLSFWNENFEKIGNEYDYTIEQIKEYKNYIDLAIEKYEIK